MESVPIDPRSPGLCGPGEPFEICEQVVGGRPMRVFARAVGNLSALYAAMPAHGDLDFLVDGDRRLSYARFHALAGAAAAGASSFLQPTSAAETARVSRSSLGLRAITSVASGPESGHEQRPGARGCLRKDTPATVRERVSKVMHGGGHGGAIQPP